MSKLISQIRAAYSVLIFFIVSIIRGQIFICSPHMDRDGKLKINYHLYNGEFYTTDDPNKWFSNFSRFLHAVGVATGRNEELYLKIVKLMEDHVGTQSAD